MSSFALDLGMQSAFATPQSQFAGTVFNFGTAGAIGDDFSGFAQTARADGGVMPPSAPRSANPHAAGLFGGEPFRAAQSYFPAAIVALAAGAGILVWYYSTK